MIDLFWRRLSTRFGPQVSAIQLRRTPLAREVDAEARLDSDLMDFDEVVTLPGGYWHAGQEQSDALDATSANKANDS